MARSELAVTIIVIILIGTGGGVAYLWTTSLDVPVGYVAVVQDSSAGTLTQVGDGLTPIFKLGALWHPLVSAQLIYVGTESIHMWGSSSEGSEQAGDDQYPAIRTLSKDGLSIDVDVTVRWKLNSGSVLSLYQLYPSKNWQDALIKLAGCINYSYNSRGL